MRCARLDVNRPTRPHAMEGHVMEAKAGRTRHQDIVASHVTGHKVMPTTTRCSSLSPDGLASMGGAGDTEPNYDTGLQIIVSAGARGVVLRQRSHSERTG